MHAEGQINGGTADSFRIFTQEHHIEPGGAVYFQTEGGDLAEGVKLGRLIRDLGLDTYIGNIDPKETGVCFSACTLAYLGGVSRFMNDAAMYSVQRFYRRARNSQQYDIGASQALAEEIKKVSCKILGVNPSLFPVYVTPARK